MYNYVLLKMSTWYSKHVEESNNIWRINNIQCITLVVLYGHSFVCLFVCLFVAYRRTRLTFTFMSIATNGKIISERVTCKRNGKTWSWPDRVIVGKLIVAQLTKGFLLLSLRDPHGWVQTLDLRPKQIQFPKPSALIFGILNDRQVYLHL